MRFTDSKDGVKRASVNIKLRLTESEVEQLRKLYSAIYSGPATDAALRSELKSMLFEKMDQSLRELEES